MSLSIAYSIATSSMIGSTAPAAPVLLLSGLIDGRFQPGSTLTVTVSDSSEVLSYRWGDTLGGAQFGTGAQPAGLGVLPPTILFLEVTTDTGTYQASVPVEQPALDITSVPSISGQPWIGDQLTAVAGTVSGPSLGTSWQWLRNDMPVPGAVAPTYVLGLLDDGAEITVEQTETGVSEVVQARSAAVIATYRAPTMISSVPDLMLDQGVTMAPINLASFVSGEAVSFAVQSGSLPVGLTLSDAILSGTPQSSSPAQSLTIRASNSGGAVSLTFTVTVTAAPPVASEAPEISGGDPFGNIWDVYTDQPNSGAWHWARQDTAASDAVADGAGGWSGTVLESGTVAVGMNGANLDIPETGATGVTYKMRLYQRTVAGDDSNVIGVTYTADNTAPALLAITAATVSEGATFNFSTDTGEGRAYGVVTTSAVAPTPQQIRDGQDHTGAAAVDAYATVIVSSGRQTERVVTGLTNGTTYHWHLIHEDRYGNVGTGTISARPTANVLIADNTRVSVQSLGALTSLTFTAGNALVTADEA